MALPKCFVRPKFKKKGHDYLPKPVFHTQGHSLYWQWHCDLRGTLSGSISGFAGLPGHTIWNRRSVTEGTYLWSHKHINTFTGSHVPQLWPWEPADSQTGGTRLNAGGCRHGPPWQEMGSRCVLSWDHNGVRLSWRGLPARASSLCQSPWTMLRRGGKETCRTCETIRTASRAFSRKKTTF